MAEYTKRDIVQLDKLGGHYSRHVSAMTVEYLHRKSEVAAELAWRDAEIARLREALERIRASAEDNLIAAIADDALEPKEWVTSG